MKKNILVGVILSCGLCAGNSSEALGQAAASSTDLQTPGSDSLVRIAYRTVNRKDIPGAISILNPPQYLDKHFGTYPLEGVEAFAGGTNLWNIGTALVLIDGVPRSIGDITTNEIEQITFLKGANAVVLYGSRAANGVMLITTKRGKAGAPVINVRLNTQVSKPKSYPDYLGAADYMTYYNKALKNDGLPALYADTTIAKYAAHSNPYQYPDIDYFSSDYLRKFFNVHTANAEFSSGTERARFYALAGFHNQNSLLNFGEGKNEHVTRLNLRGNIDLKLNDYISTYVNVSTVFFTSRNALGNYWQRADSLQPHRFAPLIPISYIAAGSKGSQALAGGRRNLIDGKYLLGGTQQFLTNPISDVYGAGYNIFTSRQFQYTSGIDVDLRNLLSGLSFHGEVSVDYSNRYNESVNNTYAIYVPSWNKINGKDSITDLTMYNKDAKPGTQNLSNTWSDQLIDFNFHIDYKNTFQEKHNVSVMFLADGMRRRQTGDYQYRTNANAGLHLGYNFDQRYYAEFSGTAVNSTRLPAGKRVAFSPTASLGWVLSEEGFLKGSSVVDRLKLTASAGIVNTDLDFGINNYYLYDAVYSPTAYYSWADGTFVNRTTTISRGQNLGLTYAKRKEFNLTIEGALYKGKIGFMASLFHIKKDGMPVQNYSLYPDFFFTGYPETSFVPYANFGANRYQGFDFSLNFHERVGAVKLTIGAAGTYVTTKALKRDELFTDAYRNRAGKPVDAIFGLQSQGLFGDQGEIDQHATQRFGTVKPGDIRYVDQNGDKVIDERDEVMLGRWGSPFTGGLNITAQWKDFTLFVLGTGSFGGTAIRNGDYFWVTGAAKYSGVVRNSWTEETKNNASYPALSTLGSGNNFRNSDYWTYSTDRFNISKVQLTWSLPKKILKGSFVKGVNIYVSGFDLLTIAKNRDIMELNIGSIPQTRSYNFGVKGEF
ncbi:SusC/RagA family TonB-linked outer membrane protein [Pseudobacter ginsenosidimutans]|uniref:TonB-linked SusC/RagA family outer membrane protein n=1 Tax=Pseudobacter ginsenosidimutans TaxID=661488 RepID=A0A4Q7MDL1_9BACT|nr:SusC/RagA family TonB-linked outer membrane protein [Pseudobacter ginsenosidimutans]QEC45187.1 SusC/RagA family TonB-linked outer membrane protein [Pseudobacter ginsenosidimutans]RZS65453.1 TonB-linked SusC/RagA family outer membrane protein [Pseudobacter ginsenosidimutans]